MLPLKRTALEALGWDKIDSDVVLLHCCPQSCMPKHVRGLLCLWRHGRGLAGARDISHRGFLGWRSALWCSFLLWSLPVLQQWSLLVVSIWSVWSSAWLCLGDWWGWSVFSFCTTAGCLSWEVWWPRAGSSGFAILLSTRFYCRLLWERWLRPLHLLGPVLLWMLSPSADFPFSNDGTAASTSLWRIGWLSCLSVLVQFSTDGSSSFSFSAFVQLRAVFCPSVQYLSFFCEAFSWAILDNT